MRKIFLISLMTLCTCVMAFAEGHATQQEGDVAEMKVVIGENVTTTYFANLQDAFNSLPDNSYPAIVKLLTNSDYVYGNNGFTILKYQNVTLDLNNFTIYSSSSSTGTTQVIWNKGTLTVEDNSEAKEGKITNVATGTDVLFAGNLPSYAYNIIKNEGTVVINSGILENQSTNYAAYAVDNNSTSNDVKLTVNGGTLYCPYNDAVRLFCNSTTKKNEVIINGGELISNEEGCGGVWIQLPSGTTDKKGNLIKQKGTLTINGGTLEGTQGAAIALSSWGSSFENVNININNGTIIGGVIVSKLNAGTRTAYENVAITGGTFKKGIFAARGDLYPVNATISGGQFDLTDTENTKAEIENHVLPGFCAYQEGNIVTIGACGTATYTASETLVDDVDYSTTDVTVEENVVVTIPEDKTMEVHSLAGEGQIVVKDGATLVIGNGGLKSENEDLTQVIVEAGGTVAIGNGGITQLGAATPIEIQSDGDKSGVLLIDPNTPSADAEALAEVTVYTHAYKSGDIEHWQQLATPVKGNGMSITPLGVGQQDGVYTSIYGWDYSSDSWVRVPGMPEGSGDVTYFGKAGWSGNDILTPFAAYNLINNRLPNEEAIAYTFKGKLVGNDDMILNFPANGFCVFGNSYTAPIDLTTLFAQIQNDMASTNIDPCVYVYNSIADRFESVNAGGLWLKSIGFGDVAFTQIPAQQAFVMNLLGGGSAQSAVDYAKCVWGNTNVNKNVPIMAPKRVDNTLSAVLNINVTDGASTDRVILMEDDQFSDAYDKGYDAEKYMNGSFNIYAIAERNLAMVASDNIENTELTFAAGNAVNYTMTFGKTMGDFVLVDRANNSQVAIEEGGIYTFAAQPNYTAEARFAIVPAAKMPTAIENTEVKSNVKGIYTIMGQYLGEDFNVLPAGVYVIDGVKIVK